MPPIKWKPPCEETGMTQNITFPQTTFLGGKMLIRETIGGRQMEIRCLFAIEVTKMNIILKQLLFFLVYFKDMSNESKIGNLHFQGSLT